MSVQEHKAQTRSERLIQSMDSLTDAINRLLDRIPELPPSQEADDKPKIALLSLAH